MDASFKMKSSSNNQTNLKFAFLPNGELHVDVKFPGGFKTMGGAVYKCSNWYKNKIINTSGLNTNSNSYNSNKTSSSQYSHLSDNVICDRSVLSGEWETRPDYLPFVNEAKSRGLSCGVNNLSEKTYTSASSLSRYANATDENICNRATINGKWETNYNFIPFVQEAKKRGLSCGVTSNASSNNTYRLTDEAICNMATDGYPKSWRTVGFAKEYVLEAKKRGLFCGTESEEEKKQRIVAEKAKQEKERQAKLEKERRIKAEQDKIKKKAEEVARKKKIEEERAKKKAEEVARKKKIEEEKARKLAEARAKKEAEIRAKKLAKEKLEIKNAKNESADFYNDITSYVKISNDIDLVQLSEFFDNKPETNKDWVAKDLQSYKTLKNFINKSINFREFHEKEKDKRIETKLNLKLNTIIKLEENLQDFKVLLKENFGDNVATKVIREYIKKTNKIISDNNYEQNLSDKILSQNETYLITYKMNKNKIAELNTYLNASKSQLSQILKNNFGTKKGNIASAFLKDIEGAESLSEKELLKPLIERFLNTSQKVVAIEKKENKNIITPKINNNLSVTKTVETLQQPPEQKKFLKIVIKAQNSAMSATNDMQRGGYLSTRGKELCALLRPINFRVNNWIGTINDVDSNSDGKGVLSIKLANDIFVDTWNNSLSDIGSDTLLEPNSPVFNSAAQMADGDKVKFSGNLLPHKTHCIDEQSITLNGKVSEPEFVFKFSNIEKIN